MESSDTKLRQDLNLPPVATVKCEIKTPFYIKKHDIIFNPEDSKFYQINEVHKGLELRPTQFFCNIFDPEGHFEEEDITTFDVLPVYSIDMPENFFEAPTKDPKRVKSYYRQVL